MAQESVAPHGDLIPSGLVGTSSDMASSSAVRQIQYKKGQPPILGEAFGSRWNDNSIQWATLPGGGIIGFDLNKLTLADYRMMRDHYQVNASLSVLSFMMHQLQWKIECDNKTIRDFCQENLANVWTRLVRALSQAFWSGYSPNILQWENDLGSRRVVLTKIKDLVPEEASVRWKLVDGYAPPDMIPPKIRVYDGINTLGSNYPIPVDNTLWYPLLMENGDYYGRKLLRPAFTSWFFSIIVHLFSNRYFERCGEPVPIGRAPYDDELDVNGAKVPGRQVMMQVLQALRNRSAVVLPDQRSVMGTETKYDYDIQYLESQMRGADFERYLMRLDEEISLALFTPLLMLRTADVGSYNLGTQHTLVYMQMLNALAGDWKEYIDKYILAKMVGINFGPNAKPAKIKFRKLGDDRSDYVKTMLQQLLASGGVKPDFEELGSIAGLSLKEVEQITEPSAKPDPNADPNADPEADPNADPKAQDDSGKADSKGSKSDNAHQVILQMYARLEPQFRKSARDGSVDADFEPDLGYQRQLCDALRRQGVKDSNGVYSSIRAWLSSFAGMEFDSCDQALDVVKVGLESKIEELC